MFCNVCTFILCDMICKYTGSGHNNTFQLNVIQSNSITTCWQQQAVLIVVLNTLCNVQYVFSLSYCEGDRLGGQKEKTQVIVILTWSNFQNENECSDPLKSFSNRPGMNSTVNQCKQSRQIFLTTNLWRNQPSVPEQWTMTELLHTSVHSF